MAVNDLITVGATPLVVQAYWAAGGSRLVRRRRPRAQALVDGWKRACDICEVSWGGGETPALAGIVEGGRIDLAAACTGIVSPKDAPLARRPPRARRRDRPARLERHPRQRPQPGARARRAAAAGLSDAADRERGADRLRRGPARADRPLFADHRGAVQGRHAAALRRQHHRPRLAQAACAIRARFTYRIRARARRAAGAEVHPVARPALDDRDAYGTFNMGAGFALFVAAEDAAARRRGGAQGRRRRLGRRQRWRRGRKRLVIEPLGLEYDGSELGASRARGIAAAGRLESTATGLLAWKRGQPGQVGNEAALTVATSAGVRLVTSIPPFTSVRAPPSGSANGASSYLATSAACVPSRSPCSGPVLVSLVSAFVLVLAILIAAVLWALSRPGQVSWPPRSAADASRRLAEQPDRADDDPEQAPGQPAPVQQSVRHAEVEPGENERTPDRDRRGECLHVVESS